MNKTKRIVTTAAIAALYAATTLVIAPLSFGNYQFRISEVLVLLALFDPLYIGGLTLGCFIANMLGPNGIMDVIFGTIATFISVLAVYYTPKVIRNSKTALIIASLWPTIINGLIIGVMLTLCFTINTYNFPGGTRRVCGGNYIRSSFYKLYKTIYEKDNTKFIINRHFIKFT